MYHLFLDSFWKMVKRSKRSDENLKLNWTISKYKFFIQIEETQEFSFLLKIILDPSVIQKFVFKRTKLDCFDILF